MFPRRIKYTLFLLLISCSLFAQKKERKDSLVRLLGCDQLQQIEERGQNFRKALGHVRFEHNATLLLCDTALWNVGANTIRAIGHVRIIQNRTVLSSDNLDYFINSNLAQFRGSVVQLQDKDKNTLRTRSLDYNTKDSVATFVRGGSFRDKDGQIIESDNGSYDSKIRNFSFRTNVNMYTDSIFVKTNALDFNAGTSVAVFGTGTHAWKDDNMLSSNAGWYDRKSELFTFTRDVHILTKTQEAWSDSLVYKRLTNDAEMFGNVELLDTTRKIAAVAGYMQYIDSSQFIKMTRDPAVIAVTEDKEKRDTVYIGGDELIYWTVPKCNVPEGEFTKAEKRLNDLNMDPVNEYRRKAAEDARAAAEEAKKKMQENDPNAAGARDRGGMGKKGEILPAPWDENPEPEFPQFFFPPQLPDTLKTAIDSLKTVADSISVQAPQDSLETPAADSTKIGFLLGLRNVKVFRKDMQASCDSLVYNDLDSLVRMYRSPIVWNESNRQYSSDSLFVVIKNRALDKASLMSNAFIIVQEDSICFDQIKGTEMMAYFDSTGALKRFDSMGGASGLFFIEEKGSLATVNKFEAKMLTASFVDGNLYDLNYFEDVKSDAYPVVQLKKDERLLKGFEWQPEKRPSGPEDVTSYTPRKTEREKYENIPRAKFVQTDTYFPGYMESVYKMLREQSERKKLQAQERRRLEQEQQATVEQEGQEQEEQQEQQEEQHQEVPQQKQQELDQHQEGQVQEDAAKERVPVLGKPAVVKEKEDTIILDSAQIDSLIAGETIESLKYRIPTDPKEELKARQKAEREAKRIEKEKARDEKISKKEAKWAALDAKDAEKAAKKAAKKAEKQRVKMAKMLKARQEREAKEAKILDKYKSRYEQKKAREDKARASKKSGKKQSN